MATFYHLPNDINAFKANIIASEERNARKDVRIERLRRFGVRISMDGKCRFLDNTFVARIRRSLKYECVYLHAWETGSVIKAGVGTWIPFCNRKRPSPALGAPNRGLLAAKRRNPTRSAGAGAGAESSLGYAKTCPNIGVKINYLSCSSQDWLK